MKNSNPAQMAQPKSQRIAHLDGFRAVAAILVLTYHALPGTHYATVLSKCAYLGVAAFFVLSGYLISRPFVDSLFHTGESIDIRSYFIRRFARIVPLYYTVLFSIVVLGLFIHPDGFGALHFSLWDILKHILFLQIFAPRTFLDLFAGNAWTLSAELFFYLSVPLLFYCLMLMLTKIDMRLKALVAVLVCIVILGVLCRARWSYSDAISNPAQLLPFMSLFSFGVLVALLQNKLPKLRKSQLYVSLVAGFIIMAATFLNHIFWARYVSESFGLAFALILLYTLLAEQSFLSRILSIRPVIYLGTISYGIYIWQVYLLYFASYVSAFHLRVPIAFVLTIAVSALTYHLIEKPAIDWARGLGLRKPAEAELEAQAL